MYDNKLHVVACAASGALYWTSVASLHFAPHQAIVVALLIFAVYQLNRLSDVDEDERNCPEHLAAAFEHRRVIMWVSCGCGLAAGALALSVDGWRVMPLGLLAALLAILYSGGIGALSLTPKVKRIPGVKNLVPAACWTAAAVFYPALASQHWGADVGLAAALMFCGCLAVELLWDVRDVPGDRGSGISTIPTLIGVPRTRRLLIILLGALSTVLIGSSLSGFTFFSPALVPVGILLAFTIRLRSSVKRRAYDDLVLALALSLLAGWGAIQVQNVSLFV
ncbi:MAG: UbiA family prenyltransferase [Myxococcales bacterium]|nr:UbiA family prenyltransferase [Myxococcales bacterium]